ncbi:hypothetical protein [Gorillibacterium sp. CAU 1737]|uniref:hypothetical protein n=1 Tax=Gorillibacterium sp. CAU 1737 TaxID=3140362 RepID=UPI003260174D
MLRFGKAKKTCSTCESYSDDFLTLDYSRAFSLMKQLVEQGAVTFYAGSCPLDTLEVHLEREDLFTIQHYFKCGCGRFYFTGYCVRGRPIVKILDSLPDNLLTLSGHYGAYFGKA